MVRHKGLRKKSRKKLKKHPRERGMPPVTASLRDLPIGSKVTILVEPSVQKGMPHPRYHGRVGTVVEKRGRAFVVHLTDGGKIKKIIARPEHLRMV